MSWKNWSFRINKKILYGALGGSLFYFLVTIITIQTGEFFELISFPGLLINCILSIIPAYKTFYSDLLFYAFFYIFFLNIIIYFIIGVIIGWIIGKIKNQ